MSRQNTKETDINHVNPKLTHSDMISLLDIYEREWEYRNSLFWKQVYRLFYLSLVIIILPKITKTVQINLPQVPMLLFPIIGLGVAVFSLVMSRSYGVRTEASSETYKRVMELLPPQYRRVTVDEIRQKKQGKKLMQRKKSIFNWKQQYVISTALFITEVLVAMVVFFDLIY